MNEIETIQNKLEEAIGHLESRFLEREELIRLLLLGLMAGENALLVGPPGTAKSQLARAVSQLFGSGRWFDYLLTRFTTPDEMFGPVSLRQLKQDQYVRQTDGYLPAADFAFLDEIFKANSAILNALLSILNERIFFNGQTKEQVPLLFLMAASNELPEENDQLAALYDRFLIRYEVGYLKQMSSYERMFQLLVDPLPPLLSLRDIETIRSAADGITIPESLIYMLYELKSDMEEKEFVLSDRRWRKIGHVWKTSAALNGRTEVGVWDTVYTPHMLWDLPEDYGTMQELFQKVFQEALKQETERELPLRRYDQIAKHWLAKEEELHAFQFKKEVGARLSKEDLEKAKSNLEVCRTELEETARELRGKLVQWLQREKDLPGYIRNRNFLLIQTAQFAVKYTHLRIQGERTLQTLQGLYRTLFDREIPGVEYDYTL
ncbi:MULTISPECIES: AAA family ATPase [unclassified Paenibacillus]|uniref:AAA family ATPase n=1 Tax=unclassified Paenibacillus TaxID=185978 RepID=UPI001AE2115F|nr:MULTISPECIES: AAA family ATPase [unclassified Paenibacillus]MBP1155578.1 MoxR-like ATPase [Paenibacillus sp. PvP091]MBP1169036.1 MoxR-like ATPase [Paenibacillus sp. PvR098]MBP2440064.1 MoxR-like ATPase [Paenibacillus sp. PvP052]